MLKTFFDEIFSDVGVYDAIRVTFQMAVTSTLLSALMGTFFGLALERFSFPGKKTCHPNKQNFDGSSTCGGGTPGIYADNEERTPWKTGTFIYNPRDDFSSDDYHYSDYLRYGLYLCGQNCTGGSGICQDNGSRKDADKFPAFERDET